MTVQTTVPSNLVPTRITQLPEYQGLSTAGFLPYVIDGVTYKVQFSNIAAVGAVPSSRTITGGSGLTGGGDLSANRVISIAAGGVGFSQLADSGVVAGAYGDPANIPVLTVDAKGRVTVASTTPINLGGYVPTSRSISAGAGLTGGGTLAADRTISLTLSTATPQSGGVPSAGTATVAAREDHVHPAVDLSDATETSGVLPMSRGGTGSSLSPVAGAILYSDGSNLDLSNTGTAEQVFFSQGTAAPIFRSLTGGTTGLSFGLAGSAYALSGTLAIASGGTNATTVPAARVNLLPNYTGNANKVLALNAGATDIEWLALTGTGTVTSVNLTAGTGISVSGGPITTSGSITVVNTAPDQIVSLTGAGTTVVTGTYPNFTITSNDSTVGTVTSVSVVTANGLSGSVANSTTTPAITLTTTVTGLVKGNGTALSAASAGTDYVAPGAYTTSGLTMTTARLLGRTTASSGAAEEITVGTGLLLSAGSLTNSAPDQVVSLTGAGTTAVTGTYPNFTITSNDAFVGTVTSVAGSGGTTGLTLTGGPITTAGTLTLGGTLAVANGGTGATVMGTARTNLGAAASGANTDITSIALTTGTISAAPTSGTDIVNKLYADSIASGINFHQSVRLATAAALPANTYNNGASGVGATLTANANGALSVDGVAVVAGNRILVKNEAAGANNGVYTVTQVGNGSTPYILTRATDFDSAGTGVDQIDAGDFFLVTAGSTQSNTSWVQQTPLPITVGTTAIVFTQFAAPVLYSAGTGLTLAGTVFSITNTGVTANTYGSASSVPVIAVNAQGQITSASSSSIAIDASQITSGVLAVANGGTGQSSYTNGQLLIGNTTGNTLTKATLTAGTNISITNGAGAITINATDQFVGTVTSVSGTGTVNGITLTGTVTSSGSLTLGGTLSGVSLTTQVSGTLPVANGGTNATAAPTAGAVAYGTGTAYAFTGAGTAGQVLVSNGASAPTFGGIDGGTF